MWLTLAWLLMAAQAGGNVVCPAFIGEWISDPSTGKRYRHIYARLRMKSHADSTAVCVENDSFLPEPKNKSENDFLKKCLKPKNGHFKQFFLGLHWDAENLVYRWDRDDSEVTWSDWRRLRLKSFSRCVLLATRGWIKDNCNYARDSKTIVCEREPAPTTDSPSSSVTTTRTPTTTTPEETVLTTDSPTSSATTTTTPEECQFGKFGLNCTRDCHCKDVCDKTTGRCLCGCLPGWKHSDCQQPDCSHKDYCGIHTCQELHHNYNCSCLDGYENSDSQHCEDIDECKQDDICDIHTCHNYNGSFDCICNDGSYDNIDHQLCVLHPTNPDESQSDSWFLVQDIKILVIEGTLAGKITLFFVVVGVLAVHTVVTAIYRFITTEPYIREIYACPYNSEASIGDNSIDIILFRRTSSYYSCYGLETEDDINDETHDDINDETHDDINDERHDDTNEEKEDIVHAKRTRFHSIFSKRSETSLKSYESV